MAGAKGRAGLVMAMIPHSKMLEIRKIADNWWGGVAGIGANEAIKMILDIINTPSHDEYPPHYFMPPVGLCETCKLPKSIGNHTE